MQDEYSAEEGAKPRRKRGRKSTDVKKPQDSRPAVFLRDAGILTMPVIEVA
jgi:hypothetical protein